MLKVAVPAHEYTINPDLPLRHPAETGLSVRDLMKLLTGRTDENADAAQ